MKRKITQGQQGSRLQVAGRKATKREGAGEATSAAPIPSVPSAADPFSLGDKPPPHAWARVTYADLRVAVGHMKHSPYLLYKRITPAVEALNNPSTLGLPGCLGVIVAQNKTRVSFDGEGNRVVQELHGSMQYYVTTMRGLEDMLTKDRWVNERYFYESLSVGRPLHLFADLDPKMDQPTSWFTTIAEFEDFMVEVLAEINRYLCERLCVTEEAIHVSVCESNRAGRASWHITWEVEGRMFRDFNSAGAFMRCFEVDAVLRGGECSVYDSTSRWYMQREDGGLPEFIIDMNVYNNPNRCFRTVFSTKAKHVSVGGHYMKPCLIPDGLDTAGGLDGCGPHVAVIRAQSMIFPVFGEPEDEVYLLDWPYPGHNSTEKRTTTLPNVHWPLASVPEKAHHLMTKQWWNPPEGFAATKGRRARLKPAEGASGSSSVSGRAGKVTESGQLQAAQLRIAPGLVAHLVSTVKPLWRACVEDLAKRTAPGKSAAYSALIRRGEGALLDVEYQQDTNSLYIDHRTHLCPRRAVLTRGAKVGHENNQTYLYVHEALDDAHDQATVMLYWKCFGTTHETTVDARDQEVARAVSGRYRLRGPEAQATAEALAAIRDACQVRPAAVIAALMRKLGLAGDGDSSSGDSDSLQ